MLGGAYQAKHGLLKHTSNYVDITSVLHPPALACEPYGDAAEIYAPMVQRYRDIVKELVQKRKWWSTYYRFGHVKCGSKFCI